MIKRTISYFFIFLLFISIFLAQILSATTGFGPAEIFCNNKKDTMTLGTASLINGHGDEEPKYGIFTLFNPYINLNTWQIVQTEIIHARVVCLDCRHGMQRYEVIPGYTYGDFLVGRCITTINGVGCGSENLRFYELIPRDEFQYLWLETAGNFHLEKISDSPPTWITEQKITSGGACNVNIMYDASNSFLMENFGKHWEFHLRGCTNTKKEVTGFMAAGVDLRILLSFKFLLYIEIITPIVKGEPFIVRVTYGDNEGSWNMIPPEGTQISFDGETQYTDSEGTATFVFPDDRGDYEYTLTAESDDSYEPVTRTITQGSGDTQLNNNDGAESFFSLSNPWFIIIIIICAIAVIVLVIWIRHNYYY